MKKPRRLVCPDCKRDVTRTPGSFHECKSRPSPFDKPPPPRISKALLERVARRKYGKKARVVLGKLEIAVSLWSGHVADPDGWVRRSVLEFSREEAMRALLDAMGAK